MDRVLLQFSSQADPISWGIRYLTRGDFSHVDLVLYDGSLLGARFVGGVEVRPPHYARFATVARFHIWTTRAAEVYEAAISQIGKPYDYRALLGRLVGRDWHDDRRWFCSELVAWALQRAHVPALRFDQVDRVMPADLLLSPYLCREGGDL